MGNGETVAIPEKPGDCYPWVRIRKTVTYITFAPHRCQIHSLMQKRSENHQTDYKRVCENFTTIIYSDFIDVLVYRVWNDQYEIENNIENFPLEKNCYKYYRRYCSKCNG